MHVRSELKINSLQKLDKLIFKHVISVQETEKGFHLPYLRSE